MKAEIKYQEAKIIADNIVGLLSEHCLRIEIAGSIGSQDVTHYPNSD